MDWEPLHQAARTIRERAYAPYSRFSVGAALLGESGAIYTGCNVENRSFGLCICAERSAVTAAVAAGEKRFKALVVVADCSPVASPCGMCRETLSEFARDLPVLLVNLDGERQETNLSELHPCPFEWPDTLPLDA